MVLTENHRSTQVILDAATRLIAYNNPYRLEVIAGLDKRLRSARRTGPAGAPPPSRQRLRGGGRGGRARSRSGIARGYRPRDLAILVRSNSDADPFLRALNVKGLPHRFTGNRGLYAREEVRLLVSFLRALASPDDSVPIFHLAGGELYAMPERDLIRLNRHSARKNRPAARGAARAARGRGAGRRSAATTREAAARLRGRPRRARPKTCPRRRTGEVLYRFLQSSGLLARLSKEASAEAEARVKNIARFFEIVKGYGDVAEHDRVPAFVAHLDLLREAGDDPAVAEADPDDDAVPVLTVHKAKGLEFPVVFLVGCVEQKFPLRARRDPLELPADLLPEAMPGGDPHLQEERRLFYVAMTRAKEELILTSAADYGTARARKVSRFAVEALDLPSPAPAPAQEPGPGGARAPSALAARRRRAPTRRCRRARRSRSPSGRSTTIGPARSSTSTSIGSRCRSSSITAWSTAARCTRRCRRTSARGRKGGPPPRTT